MRHGEEKWRWGTEGSPTGGQGVKEEVGELGPCREEDSKAVPNPGSPAWIHLKSRNHRSEIPALLLCAFPTLARCAPCSLRITPAAFNVKACPEVPCCIGSMSQCDVPNTRNFHGYFYSNPTEHQREFNYLICLVDHVEQRSLRNCTYFLFKCIYPLHFIRANDKFRLQFDRHDFILNIHVWPISSIAIWSFDPNYEFAPSR